MTRATADGRGWLIAWDVTEVVMVQLRHGFGFKQLILKTLRVRQRRFNIRTTVVV